MGIILYGETDEDGQFQMEYYYPYLYSEQVSTTVECTLKKQGGRESYAGLCEDYHVGVSLIFYLTNVIEMHKEKLRRRAVPKVEGVQLAALAESGMFPASDFSGECQSLNSSSSWIHSGWSDAF